MFLGCCSSRPSKRDDGQAPLDEHVNTPTPSLDNVGPAQDTPAFPSNAGGSHGVHSVLEESTFTWNKEERNQEGTVSTPLEGQDKPSVDPTTARNVSVSVSSTTSDTCEASEDEISRRTEYVELDIRGRFAKPLNGKVCDDANPAPTSTTPAADALVICQSKEVGIPEGTDSVEYDIPGRLGKPRKGKLCDEAHLAPTLVAPQTSSVPSSNSHGSLDVECMSKESMSSEGKEFVERDFQGRSGEPLTGESCSGTNLLTMLESTNTSDGSSTLVGNAKESEAPMESSTASLNFIDGVSPSNDSMATRVDADSIEPGTSIKSANKDVRIVGEELTYVNAKGPDAVSLPTKTPEEDTISSCLLSSVEAGPDGKLPSAVGIGESFPVDERTIESQAETERHLQLGNESNDSFAGSRFRRFDSGMLNTGFVSESSIPVSYSTSVYSESSNSSSFRDVPNAVVDTNTGDVRMPDANCASSSWDVITVNVKEERSSRVSNITPPSDSSWWFDNEPTDVDLAAWNNESIAPRKSLLSRCLSSSCSSDDELRAEDEEKISSVTCADPLMNRFREWFKLVPASVDVDQGVVARDEKPELDAHIRVYESLSLVSEAGRFPDREVKRDRRLGEGFSLSHRVSFAPSSTTAFFIEPDGRIKAAIPRKNLSPSRLKNTNRDSITSYRVDICKMTALRHRAPLLPCSPDCICRQTSFNPLLCAPEVNSMERIKSSVVQPLARALA